MLCDDGQRSRLFLHSNFHSISISLLCTLIVLKNLVMERIGEKKTTSMSRTTLQRHVNLALIDTITIIMISIAGGPSRYDRNSHYLYTLYGNTSDHSSISLSTVCFNLYHSLYAPFNVVLCQPILMLCSIGKPFLSYSDLAEESFKYNSPKLASHSKKARYVVWG